MSCEPILSKLPLFAGDDLDLREAAEVEAHLQRCLACFREYQRVVDLHETVRAAAEESVASLPPLGDRFTASVMGQVDGPPPLPRLLPRLVMVSGWAAAVILCALLAWNQLPQGHDEDLALDGGESWESSPVTALDLPEDWMSDPAAGRPLQLVPDAELPPDALSFDDVERLLLGPGLDSIPVSFPMRDLKDY